MEENSFINALIRFIARREKRISNFTRCDKELREAIQWWNDSHQTQQNLLLTEIEWELNPSIASQMGGVWDSQIRTVRSTLNSTLMNQVLDDERLDTIFAEVKNIVNNRPLTPVSEDLTGLHDLAPNDLLRPGQRFTAPSGEFDHLAIYGKR